MAIHGGIKKPQPKLRFSDRAKCVGLDLLNQAGLERFDGDPHPFGAASCGFDADALQVRAELARRDARYVRTDASALFALTFTVDPRAFGGTSTSDCANAGHIRSG